MKELEISNEVLKNKNTMIDYPKANEIVMNIFDNFYNPNIVIKNNRIKISFFDDVDYEMVGIDTTEEESYVFINQFEHIKSLFMSASNFLNNLKYKINEVLLLKRKELKEEGNTEVFLKLLRQELDRHLERYKNEMGSTLKVDLLRMFGIPIKDESFTITIEVDGETVTL